MTRLFTCLAFAAAAAAGSTLSAVAANFDHAAWEELLQKHVNDQGQVSYKRLAAEDAARLDAYLQRVGDADVAQLPEQEQLAFYLNAYNASVWKGILSGGSPESTFSRIKFFGFGKYKVAGQEMSLKRLEDDVIRGRFKDPRVHFALVCAATSCPKLSRHAYTGALLDAQLDERGQLFLADSSRNPLASGTGVKVSMIFKWFADDFVRAAGAVDRYLARFVPAGAPPCFAAGDCRLTYADYDWTMNAQPGQRP